MSFGIGCCSWSLKPQSPGALAESLVRIGVDRCQLALGPITSGELSWTKSVEILRSAGIHVVSGMMGTVGEDYSTLESIRATGGVVPDEHWPANRALAEASAGAAAEFGIPLVTFHAGFIPHEPGHDREVIVERIRVIADIFSDHGVRLGLETGQERADTLITALEEIDPPIGVNFDPANMILYGMGDPVDSIRRLAPYVVQIHIKDALPTTTPGTWGREVVVGGGAVDWPALLGVARESSRPLDLIIEREAGESREQDIQRAIEVVTKELEVGAR